MVRPFSLRYLILGALAVAPLSACGDTSEADSEADRPLAVSSAVLSHETTQDITVWAPEAEGSWPVVYMFHGFAGNRQDLAETATQLASQGVVVFAPDYRSTEPTEVFRPDIECGYRFVRDIAPEYGGDLEQPVTFVGYSLGGRIAVGLGLNETVFGPGGSYEDCFSGAPRPEVMVAIAGPYYEVDGRRFPAEAGGTMDDFMARIAGEPGWNPDADLVLVGGEDDTAVEAWQTEDATAALQAAGYNARAIVIPGGNHSNVIFKGHIEGEEEWVNVPDDPVGKEVVQIILDAIGPAPS